MPWPLLAVILGRVFPSVWIPRVFFRLWALRDSRWIPVIFLSLALQWSAVPELREMPGTLPAVPGHQAQCFFDMFRLPFQLLGQRANRNST